MREERKERCWEGARKKKGNAEESEGGKGRNGMPDEGMKV